MFRRYWWLGLVVIGVIAAGIVRHVTRPSAEELLASATQAMRQRSFARAEELARRVPSDSAEWVRSRLIAGEAATRLNRHEDALTYYSEIPEDGSDDSATALYCSGDLLFHLGEASAAEACYRRVLALRHDDPWAHEQLGKLLGMFGRRWESLPHLLALIRSRKFTIEQVLFLGDVNSTLALPRDLDRFRRRVPDDPLPRLALARRALDENRAEDARKLAAEVVTMAPQLFEGWAVLGRALFASSPEELESWNSTVPEEAATHPDVWLVRGLWRRRLGHDRAAVRCFGEAVLRAPNHRSANYHLAQSLLAVDEREAAAPFAARARMLRDLETSLNQIYVSIQREPTSMDRRATMLLLTFLNDAARLTEQLGRLWEAWAWCQVATGVDPGAEWARSAIARIQPQLRSDLPQTLADASPALRLDLSEFPLAPFDVEVGAPGGPSREASEYGPVAFSDAASAAGISFQYRNGTDPPSVGRVLPQTMGGGVAAIDYDRDAWPDLYFTQGGSYPASTHTPPHDDDRLYRNRGNGQFADCTLPTRIREVRFSHGVSAGDLDGDGFPDLYVANEGRNRLYRNNGDGTFSDGTAASGIDAERWTTSCLIADLNGDGAPDVYDVNYLAGEDAREMVCHTDGRDRTCGPVIFPAEQDQLWLSRGDGRFFEATAEAGLIVPDGKGLGIVALDLDGSGRLSLYVANDTSANFLFRNESGTPGGIPLFREMALLSGVALDADGVTQGSMGIAVDDADGNGRLDVFVTNYYQESNALYLQQAGFLFADLSREYGLFNSSFAMVGFGTQFLDGELDGWPDLVITNGHISDNSDRGEPYRMPPEYHRNLGGGRFQQLESGPLGRYFQEEHLGRGLARLDWNRDGKEDVAVTHLDRPVALLTNETEVTGAPLILRFCGVAGDRDAIGTVVSATVGTRTMSRQLTAGDGYMAGNERQLVLGLGNAASADRVEIRWTSGTVQVVHGMPANDAWLVVEGRDPYRLIR